MYLTFLVRGKHKSCQSRPLPEAKAYENSILCEFCIGRSLLAMSSGRLQVSVASYKCFGAVESSTTPLLAKMAELSGTTCLSDNSVLFVAKHRTNDYSTTSNLWTRLVASSLDSNVSFYSFKIVQEWLKRENLFLLEYKHNQSLFLPIVFQLNIDPQSTSFRSFFVIREEFVFITKSFLEK